MSKRDIDSNGKLIIHTMLHYSFYASVWEPTSSPDNKLRWVCKICMDPRPEESMAVVGAGSAPLACTSTQNYYIEIVDNGTRTLLNSLAVDTPVPDFNMDDGESPSQEPQIEYHPLEGWVPDVWDSSKSVARGGRHSAVDSGCSRSPSACRARSSECWFIPSWFSGSLSHTIFSNYLFPSPKTIHDTFFCEILCVPDFNNSDWILLISCTLTISNIPTFFCYLQAQ